MSLRLVHAVSDPQIFSLLEKFVETYEKFCVTLYEKIVTKDSGVYAIEGNSIEAVFSFSRGGSFVCCVPKWTKGIKKFISEFLDGKKISCIHGEESSVLLIEGILGKRKIHYESRNMFLMEYNGFSFVQNPASVFICSDEDCDKLMPLQAGFSEEEVLPQWKQVNLPLERMNLEHAIKSSSIYAVGDSDGIYAKANINRFSKKIVQISGVYTLEKYRCRGFASLIVNRIAMVADSIGQKATLIVRQENLAAIKAYMNAGFGICGTYRIVYFQV